MNYKIVEFDGSSHRKVLTETGVEIGLFYLDPSGFYCYEPTRSGVYPAYVLRDIAALLDEINKPYKKHLDEFFKKEQEKEKDYIIDEYTGITYPKNDSIR